MESLLRAALPARAGDALLGAAAPAEAPMGALVRAALPEWAGDALLGATPPPPPPPFMEAALCATVALWVFESLLVARQMRAVRRATSVPSELAELISVDKFAKSRAYELDKGSFALFSGLVETALNVAATCFCAMPLAWAASEGVVAQVQAACARFGLAVTLEGEAWRSVAFVLLFETFESVIALPMSAYRTFVIEARHGFNTQTLMTFVLDAIKGWLLLLVLAPPIVHLLVYVLQIGGPMLPLYLWMFVAGLQMVMMTLYPVLIMPLFNKFAPLSEGDLRNSLEALATTVGFPLGALQVVDGSKRSSHSNAYMYGFWRNKKIVLFDTLLSQATPDQIAAVLAHELGHWKHGHTMWMAIVAQAVTVAQFAAFSYVRNSVDLFRSFGFDIREGEALPTLVGLMLFSQLLTPISIPLTLVLNAVSRRFEYQADAFAAGLGYGQDLRNGLITLQEENLSSGVVDPWYSWFKHSHPVLPERLAAIEDAEKKTQ